MKRLFICHDASRTGAPLVLFNFLKKIKEKNIFEFDILLLNNGPLLKEFENISTTFYFNERKSYFTRLFYKIFKLKLYKTNTSFLKYSKYDFYYINSIASLSKLKNLDFIKNKKSILHVHELNTIIERYKVKNVLENSINSFNKIICVSKTVQNNLIKNFNLNLHRSSVIHPLSKDIFKEKLILKSLNIPKDAFIVGGCGYIELTKGFDVFVQVAAEVLKKNKTLSRPIYFVWLGKSGNELYKTFIFRDIEKMNLKSNFLILDNTDRPLEIFLNFNLFFLSSREDSFPLVAIENTKLGIPVICFDKGNGFADFIRGNGNGFVMPYMDVNKVSEKIIEISSSDLELNIISNKNIDRCQEIDNEIIFKNMLAEINGE